MFHGCNASVENQRFSHEVYMKIEDTLANGSPLQVLYYRMIDGSESIVGLKRIRYWPDTDIPFYEADYDKQVIIDKDPKGTVTGINFHHGPFLQWHDNGQLRVSGRHDEGQMHGTWTYWNKEGQIEMVRTYENDSLIDEMKTTE